MGLERFRLRRTQGQVAALASSTAGRHAGRDAPPANVSAEAASDDEDDDDDDDDVMQSA